MTAVTSKTEKTSFRFLNEIPIDVDNTLFQLLRSFRSVRDGLPELPKNSKDHYSRRGVAAKTDRQIIVLADSKKRSIGVLDFAGASQSDFLNWMEWSSPKANRAGSGSDIEGGHGNGGKAFMVWGSQTDSFVESCAGGRRTKMGYKNDEPRRRHYPAHIIENGEAVENLLEIHPETRLVAALRRFGASFKNLPADAQRVFKERNSFTIVEVNSVHDWMNRRPAKVRELLAELPKSLAQHPQMALTLESCTVWLMVDGKLQPSIPLTPSYPAPMPGFEDSLRIPVPSTLIDPETGDEVPTAASMGDSDHLVLRTSKRHLRQTDRALNVVRVRNTRNVVANWSIADLAPENESAFIYGEVRLATLDSEHLSGSDRKGLSDTPLTRALWQWVSGRVVELAHKLQKAIARDHKQQDRDKANDSLFRMRELMRQYLEPEEDIGDGDLNENGRKGKGDVDVIPPPPPPIVHGKLINKIVLEPGRSVLVLATGTAVPLAVRCFEVTEKGESLPVPVQAAKLELLHEDSVGIFGFDENRLIHAQTPGADTIRVRDANTGIESNQLRAESLACTGVDVIGVDRPLLKGERVTLQIVFHTAQGPRNDLLIEGLVDETDHGRLSRAGVFAAGTTEGAVTVRVRYGDKSSDNAACTLLIGPESMPPRRHRGSEGGGNVPLILLCGSEAEAMEEYPPDQRTHRGGDFHPTIIEDPMFRSVVWINPDSKEAMRVRQGRGGTKGSAGIATKTFTQFVALKCFEILKRLKVRQGVGGAAITEENYRDHLAEAEMACADFIDAAFEIADNLAIDQEKAA